MAFFWLVTASPLAYAASESDADSSALETIEKLINDEEPSVAASAGAQDVNAAPGAMIPSEVAGSYLSSRFARAQGDITAAVHYLRASAARQPNNIILAQQLQGALLVAGEVEEAAKVAARIKGTETYDPLSDLVLALQSLRDQRYDDALEVLQSASQNGNLQLWAPLLIGWIQLEQGSLEKPLTLEGFQIDVGHAIPLLNYHLALINEQAGFIEAAARNYRDSIEDPNQPPPRIMVRLLDFYARHPEAEALKEAVERHAKLEERPDWEGAKVLAVSGARDGVAEVLYTMGGIMYSAGVLNDAAIYLQLANYLMPEQPDILLALGDAYGSLQQYGLSNAAYNQLLPGDALYLRAQMQVAINLDRMGKQKEALKILDKLAAQNNTSPDALITRGDLFRMHGQYEKAIASYDKALARIEELSSTDWPVLFARGSCLERLGRWPEAQQDLEKALALKPDQPDVLNYLGYAQLERGQNLEQAEEMIARAVEARPNDAQIVDSMGWVLYKQGKYEEALEYMEKAVELLPSDPTVNDHLGDVYWRLGRRTEARFQWNRALSYSPDGKLAESLQKKLKHGLPAAAKIARREQEAATRVTSAAP